jgi:ATP-dependent RNA helicase SUPV3L1/SUV3
MLICGFEKFENFFVRIDILERLFIKIIENNKKNKIKLNSDMINLLGCSKDNFIKLLNLMNYKVEKSEKENEIHFRYMPKNTIDKKKLLKKYKKNDNPFNVLTNVNYN